MKRALVFVDHTDAGCAALEAARRVRAATPVQLTVVSIGDGSQAAPLAAAAARQMARAAEEAVGVEAGELAVESIVLGGRPRLTAAGLIDDARPDVAIVGSRHEGVDQDVLDACFRSSAKAVLIARPGRRSDERRYRHVAVAADAGDRALRAAEKIAGGDALLSVVGVVNRNDGPSCLTEVSLETVAIAEKHEGEPALVEGGKAEIAEWLRSHGAELMVVASHPTPASGVGLGLDLVGRAMADVLMVRSPAMPPPRGPRRRWNQRVRRSPSQAQTRPVTPR